MMTLEDKVAVVTGAAPGIGRALAVNLAGRGSLLALSDVDEPGLARTVELAIEAGAREVRSGYLDVSDRAAFRVYAESVAEHFGRVDLVINNAGVAPTGQIEDLSYEDLDWIVGANFWGVVHRTKEFLPHRTPLATVTSSTCPRCSDLCLPPDRAPTMRRSTPCAA
jgi:NAD(P)-dependent dehydrogenase (short-subunit alcohol dehydrogenase family)